MKHIKECLEEFMDDIRRQSRKFMQLRFNVHIPAWVFAKGFAKLPEDAHILAVDYEPRTGTNTMLIWSGSFKPVPMPKEPPELILGGNTETKEVDVIEVMEDGSWNYWGDNGSAAEGAPHDASPT